MTAKEMFKELGYEKIRLADENIVVLYERPVYGEKEYIYFYPEKQLRITFESKNKVYPPTFTLEELKAINKQVEELGWEK